MHGQRLTGADTDALIGSVSEACRGGPTRRVAAFSQGRQI